MKFALSLLSLLLPLSLHAEVKLPGTVLESQCADARELHPMIGGFMITKVCTGRIVGKKGTFLVVSESRATPGGALRQTTVWEMTASGASYRVKEIGFVEDGNKFSEKAATSEVTGRIRTKVTAGTTAIEKMTGDLGGRVFIAEGFRTIFHTL